MEKKLFPLLHNFIKRKFYRVYFVSSSLFKVFVNINNLKTSVKLTCLSLLVSVLFELNYKLFCLASAKYPSVYFVFASFTMGFFTYNLLFSAFTFLSIKFSGFTSTFNVLLVVFSCLSAVTDTSFSLRSTVTRDLIGSHHVTKISF